MIHYTNEERQEHLAKWKENGVSKYEYAKSAGIIPRTFYTWTRKSSYHGERSFVEISSEVLMPSPRNIFIKKGDIRVCVPLKVGLRELQNIFGALGGVK